MSEEAAQEVSNKSGNNALIVTVVLLWVTSSYIISEMPSHVYDTLTNLDPFKGQGGVEEILFLRRFVPPHMKEGSDMEEARKVHNTNIDFITQDKNPWRTEGHRQFLHGPQVYENSQWLPHMKEGSDMEDTRKVQSREVDHNQHTNTPWTEEHRQFSHGPQVYENGQWSRHMKEGSNMEDTRNVQSREADHNQDKNTPWTEEHRQFSHGPQVYENGQWPRHMKEGSSMEDTRNMQSREADHNQDKNTQRTEEQYRQSLHGFQVYGKVRWPYHSKEGSDMEGEIREVQNRKADHNQDKNTRWTEEEHRHFLHGLEVYGKGRWKKIATDYVHSKTHKQIASHAQKYFLRQNASKSIDSEMDKRRSSIHDINE